MQTNSKSCFCCISVPILGGSLVEIYEQLGNLEPGWSKEFPFIALPLSLSVTHTSTLGTLGLVVSGQSGTPVPPPLPMCHETHYRHRDYRFPQQPWHFQGRLHDDKIIFEMKPHPLLPLSFSHSFPLTFIFTLHLGLLSFPHLSAFTFIMYNVAVQYQFPLPVFHFSPLIWLTLTHFSLSNHFYVALRNCQSISFYFFKETQTIGSQLKLTAPIHNISLSCCSSIISNTLFKCCQ